MLPLKQSLPAQQQRLLKLFSSLSKADQDALTSFAEFLASRDVESGQSDVPEEATLPKDLPRPEQETVIAAIRRLSETYPMLDKSLLLNDASGVMTTHIMQGKAAHQAINELEVIFQQAYVRYSTANDE